MGRVVVRKKRIRVHLMDPAPGSNLPTVEGLLIGQHGAHYRVAVPELLVAAGAQPLQLQDARELMIPRDRVAFIEVLR